MGSMSAVPGDDLRVSGKLEDGDVNGLLPADLEAGGMRVSYPVDAYMLRCRAYAQCLTYRRIAFKDEDATGLHMPEHGVGCGV